MAEQKIPPVSVVIPTLNEEKYLPKLLTSLSKVEAPLEVIVVDGNSEDKTGLVAEELESLFSGDSSLRVISSPRGIARQRNAGARHAKNDILMFCDADILIPSSAIYHALIAEFVEQHYFLATPALVSLEPDFLSRLIYKISELSQKFLLLVFKKPFFQGPCLITTKEAFEELNGFNETMAWGEDTDFALRAAKRGPCGILHVDIYVSARRFLKYGHFRTLFKWATSAIILIFGGTAATSTIAYPLGKHDE